MEERIALISMLVVTTVVGALLLFYPRITRRGLLFGVYVGERHATHEAAEITHSWYGGMGLVIAASLVIGLCVRFGWRNPMGGPISTWILLGGFVVMYLRTYRRARALAVSGTPTTAAVLVAESPQSLLLPMLAVALGVAGGLYALGYVWSHYGALPDRIPTHFGAGGRPDAWGRRSFGSVMAMPLMALILGGGLGAIACLVAHAKRAIRYPDAGVSLAAQQRFRRGVTMLLTGTSILVTIMAVAGSISVVQVALGERERLHPLFIAAALGLVVYALAGCVYLAVRIGQGGARLERAAGSAPLTDGLADNAKWRLGIFYVNREDPSFFVEHRFGLGYTINLGNPKAVALLVGFLVLIGAMTVLVLVSG